jgi:exodeoxyribonuclease V alpha subunit
MSALPAWWATLEKAARERGVLDEVDLALVRTLARKSGREEDADLRAVLACLIAAVRSGGLRIPIAPEAMAPRLEEYLRGLDLAPGSETAGAGGESPETFRDLAALARGIADRFAEARLAGAYAAVLGRPEGYFPLIHSGRGLYFQKHQAAEAAVSVRLKKLLAAPDRNAPPEVMSGIFDAVLSRYPMRLSSGADAPAMEFDPRQRDALALALRKRFTVISGGPGTGKTSLAANLLRAFSRAWFADPEKAGGAGPRIRLAAPTGRAAQRLSESIRRSLESVRPRPPEGDPGARADGLVSGLACATLHSLLRYNPGTGEYFHQAHRPLPADLVLIDEVSMVDIFALARLLDSLEEGACLVLLGDMDQLPSVEAGSVLADLVPAGQTDHALRDHLAILDRSHRSEAGILEVTRRINAMDGPGALAAMGPPMVLAETSAPWPIAFMQGAERICPGGGCRMLAPPGTESSGAAYRAGWDAWLQAWVDFHYLEHSFDPARHPGKIPAAPRRAAYAGLVREICALPDSEDPGRDALLDGLFAYLDQARILTLTRKGWHGAESVNRRIRARLQPMWDPGREAGASEAGGFTGSPILILENDYGKGLYNGDVGVQARIRGRDLAFFRRADAYLAFPIAFLPRHETAFAMTVHKSQGSEYDYALVVLPEAGNRLLYKETLYTALTRARLFAGIYGPRETFLEAVSRKVVRESGLPDYLASPLLR